MASRGPQASLAEDLSARQKRLLLASLMLTLFLAALDQTIVATATPRILADLGGFDLLSWLFTSYLLASTVVVPLVGKLGDMWGRRLFLLVGIIWFTAASALCGLAPNIESLIAFRALQGLGGGLVFATVFAVTGDLFSPAERGRYMGLFTGVFSLASVIGPTLGGFLTDSAGWRWVFYVNLPVAAVALPAIWRTLPPIVARPARRTIDFAGAALLGAASISLLLALEWGGSEYGWSSPLAISLFAAAAVFIALFVAQERRAPEPILPLHLFRNWAFLGPNLLVFALGMAMFGGIAYLPTFVQTGLGSSATASGVVTTPQSIGLLVVSVLGGHLLARTGRYKYQTVAGTVLIVVAVYFLTTIDIGMSRWLISAYMVILGAGIGLIMPTMSVATQNAVPYEYLGVATSANQFFRQVGAVIGVAIFGVILANSYSDAFDDRVSPEIAATVPANLLAEFDNPTVAVNESRYAELQQGIRERPGGADIASTLDLAVRTSVETGTRHVFYAALIVGLVTIVLAVSLKEIPLRRTVRSPEPAQAQSSPTGGREPEAAANPLPGH